MHRKHGNVENQEGSVLLIALIILLLVSMLGLNSLRTTSTELKISGNDRSYKQNFYRAEAVIKEAAFALENSDDLQPSSTAFDWLKDGLDTVSGFDPEEELWNESGTDANASESAFYTDNKAEYCALRRGITAGSNLDMSQERKWEYVIYGRSELSSGRVDMAAGYLKKSK
jgi:hypothetical protein